MGFIGIGKDEEENESLNNILIYGKNKVQII